MMLAFLITLNVLLWTFMAGCFGFVIWAVHSRK